QSAVDRDHRAGNVAGLVGGEEADRGGDLLGGAEAAEGHGVADGGPLVVVQRVGHVGGDGAGGDDVDGDVPGGELACERAGEAHEAGLRCRVVGLPGLAGGADDRGEEDDAAEAGPHHRLHGPAGGAERAGEVRVEHVGEVVVGHAQDEAVAGDARVGDEDLDRAELGLDLGERVVDLGGVAHVAGDAEQARVVGWGGAVGDGHLVARVGEGAGGGEPDAPVAAGDEDDASVGGGHGCHLMTAEAQVMPAPKPTSRTRSPGSMRPSSAAAAIASGIEAEEVLPVRSSTVTAFSVGMPSLSQAESMMRMFAWWGMTTAMSSAVMPARSSAARPEATITRTARRNTSRPSMRR